MISTTFSLSTLVSALPWMFIAALISCVCVPFIRIGFLRIGLVDCPDEKRRLHEKPIAFGGGLVIYFAILICFFLLLQTGNILTAGEINTRHYVGFFIGGFFLLIGGYLDDRYRLPPHLAILAPLVAAFAAVLGGIQIEKLTNPFGGIIFLESWQSDILVFSWLFIVTYTTKILDGLDGLATGDSAIGTGIILLFASSLAYFQPDIVFFSAMAFGALIGFLPWNFFPASMFLGEGGSTFVGYLLGTLAIISGGKLAVALLVLGIPLLDIVWVVLRRWRQNGFTSIFKGDRKHLHHRLLDAGFSQRQVVFFYYIFAGTFGILTLFLQSGQKLVAFGGMILFMILLAIFFVW